MRLYKPFTLLVVLAMLSATWVPAGAAPMADGGFTRQIASGGNASFASAPPAVGGGVQDPELAPTLGNDAANPIAPANQQIKTVDRSNSHSEGGNDRNAQSGHDDQTNPKLSTSFDGLNFNQQRFANGGNQFSVEPPDQGMCAGNGFVVESVNDVFRVYHTDGSPATSVVDLNTFYGYPAAIQRPPLPVVQGPFVTDPSCLYDKATGRFFNVVLTLDVKPTSPHRGAFLGPNHLDIAVSNTSDPTGAWTIYRLPVQDDGTNGTPNHKCAPSAGPPPAYRTNPNACIGDYPHIGADANGFYITTNEYDFFGDAFHGAQIYAISKSQLASLPASLTVTQFDTAHDAPGDKPGFTTWPSQGSGGPDDNNAQGNNSGDGPHGTEYFLSSTAADEAQCDSEVVCSGTGTSQNILLWALRGTASLNTATPALTLSNKSIKVDRYSIPPKSNQKAGDFPQGQCINDTTMPTPFGPGCWQYLFVAEPAHNEVISHLDSNDTRMQQVSFANSLVWGALDTDVIVAGAHRAGIQYFAVKTGGELVLQGTLALKNNNLTYPAIGVLPNGRGVMAFTVVGDNYYPSAGYASIDAENGAGDIHIAAAGLGPDDGFTSYKAQVGDPPRTRWGDYGAAAVDGNGIWIASEYIGQTCTLAQYVASPFGRCGGTRAALGNWDTRISLVTP